VNFFVTKSSQPRFTDRSRPVSVAILGKRFVMRLCRSTCGKAPPFPSLAEGQSFIPLCQVCQGGAVKELKIGCFRQEACAGAPAPPRWNARSARVFGCGFGTAMGQVRPNSIFSQLQGDKWRTPGKGSAFPQSGGGAAVWERVSTLCARSHAACFAQLAVRVWASDRVA
jgi:hypothetical protein